MATLPTPEENGRLVLEIYAQFGLQSGQTLLANNFVAVAARRRIPIAHVQGGLEYAAKAGWIEQAENGSLRFTESGFAALPQRGPG